MKNLDRFPRQPYPPPPPPPPQIEDGKMARFALCAASSLIWRGLGCCSNLLCQDRNLSDFSENNKLNGYARAFNPLNPHGCSA